MNVFCDIIGRKKAGAYAQVMWAGENDLPVLRAIRRNVRLLNFPAEDSCGSGGKKLSFCERMRTEIPRRSPFLTDH